jgi:uncharacterized membrane protein
MSLAPEVLLAVLLMGLASHLCRFCGFFLMGFVRLTPGVEAWLKAIPVALIGAILGPVAANGGPPEWLALAVAVAVMRLTRSDFGAIAAAMAVAAAARAL